MTLTLDQLLSSVDKAVKDLPTLPHVVERVLAISSNPDSSMRDLEHVISTDPSLSARILRVANSGLYALPQRIASISQASTILGFRIIRSLCLSIPIMDALGHEWGPVNPLLLRRHSLAVGAAARYIARRKRSHDPETAFTAGLLHDVGKILLSRTLPKEYAAALKKMEERYTSVEAEKKLLGQSHDQVGAIMLSHWGLPVDLVSAVESHHNPPDESLALIVSEANAIAVAMGYGIVKAHAQPDATPAYPGLRESVERAMTGEASIL